MSLKQHTTEKSLVSMKTLLNRNINIKHQIEPQLICFDKSIKIHAETATDERLS